MSLVPRNFRVFPLLAGVLVCTSAAAQSVKLNDRLTGAPTHNVASYLLAAGGTRAVFVADLGDGGEIHSALLAGDGDGSATPVVLTGTLSGTLDDYQVAGSGEHVFVQTRTGGGSRRLFRVPAGGGPPLLLSGSEQVLGFLLDETATRVVYLAESAPGVDELFSAPADGSSPRVRLNGTLVPGGDVRSKSRGILGDDVYLPEARISPDGTRVVYLADQDADEVVDLYSVPIDGSAAAIRLNQSAPLADVEEFEIAFDSLGVVYTVGHASNNDDELYAVRIDGSLPPALRSAPGSQGEIEFQLAKSSDRLVWLLFTPWLRELYSVGAIAGGTPVKLNPPLGFGESVISARVSANGARVVYLADQEMFDVYDLYTVPADGSAPAERLTSDDHWLTSNTAFEIADGTARVLFESDASPFDPPDNELYSVPLAGGQPAVRLHGDLPLGGFVERVVGVLPDATVLFLASLDLAGQVELLRAPIDGTSAPIQLNDELSSGCSLTDVQFTPGGERVAFIRESAVFSFANTELFSVLASGGGTVRLVPQGMSGPPPLDVATDWKVTSDGSRVVYVAAEAPVGAPELHAAASDGHGRSITLNSPIAPHSAIDQRFLLSPDGTHAVYVVTRAGRSRIHAARTDVAVSSVQLDLALPEDWSVSPFGFAITPGSSDVVFIAQNSSGAAGGVFVAPIDGGQPPVELAATVSFTALAGLTPDGTRAVYRMAPGYGPLYSVPIDGGSGPVLLDTQAAQYETRFTADSSRAVYAHVSPAIELRSVHVDGSQPAVRLDNPAQGEIVPDYLPSPDGSYVVYRTLLGGINQLYSVPVGGGTAPVRLNSALVAGGSVAAFAIDPSSTRVVYSADQLTDNVVELFSAPIDGSAPAVRVSGVPDPALDVLSLVPLRPGSGRVVYATGGNFPGRIYSALLDGSAPPTALSPAFSGTPQIEVTADGAGVVCSAPLHTSSVFEVFHMPIDGSAPPRAVSGPMTTGGDVEHLVVGPNGELVVYRADEEQDGVFELFSAWIERPPRRASTPTRSVFR